MKIIYLVFIVLCGSTCFYTCASKDEDAADVVAQVNEATVTNSDLENAITQTTAPEVKAAVKRKLMEKWIEDEIFYQAALEEGMVLSRSEKFMIEKYEKRLLVEKYLQRHINLNFRVLDQEIEDYYNKHRQEFIWDEDYVRLIHLVMENEDRVINDEIRKSNDLNEVIANNFFDQQSTRERPIGDLGYIKISDLPQRLASRVRSMKTGRIRGPIKTDVGYHYLQLLDRQKKDAVKELDLVRDEIILRLKIEKRKKEIESLKQKLRSNFTIQTDLAKLSQQ